MTLHMKSILFSVVFGIVVVGCDSSFSPKGPHEPKVTVYSILSPNDNRQFVRLGLTYDVEGLDPASHSVEEYIQGATVSIIQGGKTYLFRDTLIQRKDSSRYSTPIRAYVAQPFQIVPGSKAQLSVVTPSFGTLTAETAVPASGRVRVTNAFVLQQPSSFESKIIVLIDISAQARGYLLRHYIVFEVFKNGSWIPERREFPVSVILSGGTNVDVMVYPKLERRSSEAYLQNFETETVVIDQLGYQMLLESIFSDYGSGNLKFRYVLFELNQVDPHLYSYYNIANGFQDEFSIRTDLPDYSNIRGGVGVFGSFMVDTSIVRLLERF